MAVVPYVFILGNRGGKKALTHIKYLVFNALSLNVNNNLFRWFFWFKKSG